MKRETAARFYACRQCTELHCHWCGRDVRFGEETRTNKSELATKEHMVPKSKGGTDHSSNIELACKRCNNHRKSDMDWVSYHDHLGDPDKMAPSQRAALGLAQITTVGDESEAVLSPSYTFYSQSNPWLKTCVRCGMGYDQLDNNHRCNHCARRVNTVSKYEQIVEQTKGKPRCTLCRGEKARAYKEGKCYACYELSAKWAL